VDTVLRLLTHMRDPDFLRAYTFTQPTRIPIRFEVNYACLEAYDLRELRKLVSRHSLLFKDHERSFLDPRQRQPAPWQTAGSEYEDSWGSTWRTTTNGITGTVIRFPLADWAALGSFRPPDPEEHDGWTRIDWEAVQLRVRKDEGTIGFSIGELRHGFFFLTLEYLRGYENLVYDMHDQREELHRLIAMVEAFNAYFVRRYLELDVSLVAFPEDLGAQNGPMLSPELFRRYIRPSYGRLMQPVRKGGKVVYMHSDGHILELLDDLIACGVTVINLQDRVNGIDEIGKRCKGRIAVDLDIDRQEVTRNGSPKDVEELIREAVAKLSGPRGGLSLVYDLYPGIPIRNVEAVMRAMEEYSTLR
jgi:uroporphyrinogen decarboxylase